MSQQVHVLRLGPARRRGSYRDYKSGLYLTYPEKVEGTVPFGVDLTNLYRSVKMKQLEDVNGTVVAEYEARKKGREGHAESNAPVAAVEPEAPKQETKPEEIAEAAPADDNLLETAVEADAEQKTAKKKRNSSKK